MPAVAGMPIDLPLGHKDEVWSFDHLDTVIVMGSDGPRRHKIVLCMAASGGCRPHPEIAFDTLQSLLRYLSEVKQEGRKATFKIRSSDTGRDMRYGYQRVSISPYDIELIH